MDFGISEIAALTAASEAAAGTAAAAEGAGALGALGTGAEALGTAGALGSGAGALGSAGIASLVPESVATLGPQAIGAYTSALSAGYSTTEALAMAEGAAQAAASGASTFAPVASTTAAPLVPAAPVSQGIAGATTPIGSLGAPVEFSQAEAAAQAANQAQQVAQATGSGVEANAAQAAADQAVQNLGSNAAYSTTAQAGSPGLFDQLGSGLGKYFLNKDGTINWMKVAGAGLGGAGLMSMVNKPNNLLPKFQPLTGAQVGLGATLSPNYAPQRRFADGGIAALSPNPTYPMSQQQSSRYAVPSQMPVGATDVRMAHLAPVSMAHGGHLGDYSDGGRLLKGPGDGVSDNIPASIGGKQPARLADGEFVVPARIVSELGNGSTDAGARQLYKMMDNIQKARKKTLKGKDAFAKDTKASKYLPKA